MSGKVWENIKKGSVFTQGDLTKAHGHVCEAQPETEVLCRTTKEVKARKEIRIRHDGGP